MSFRKTVAGAVVALGMTMGGGAFAATIVNLGFGIDHSGSMTDTEYELQKIGLANALALIPTSGDYEYRVSVISFGGDVRELVAPTIVTAANIGNIQTDITSFSRNTANTSYTYTGTAINTLTANFTAYDMANTLTMFNISTDGAPNGGANVTVAAQAAFNAGLDSLSFEAVGATNFAINNMLALAGPNAILVNDPADLPNATQQGFVFEVNSFDDYESAISAKVQSIIDDVDPPSAVPLPAALPLLLGALGLLGGLRLRSRAA